MKKLIEKLIAQFEDEIAEIEEVYGSEWEDFNPMDASGGNFDDAYNLGYEHGQVYGRYELLKELLKDCN
jgi:hypothetical protein